MRPRAIIAFEYLTLLSAVLGGLLQDAIGWQQIVQPGSSVVLTLGGQLAVFGTIFLLVLLVSRRRSRVAMWIWIVLWAVGLIPFILYVQMLAQGRMAGSAIVAVLQALLQGAGIVFLFTPKARSWMRARPQR